MNNNINCDYIDALNSFGLVDYVNDVITNDITTSNIYMNDGSTLNQSFYYSNADLIIRNNYDLKEIKFFTYFNYTNFASLPGVKIDNIGKLQVYHLYNLLQPTFPAGYYDVEAEILQLKADGINTDLQLTLLEAGGVFLQSEITALKNTAINTFSAIETIENSLYNNNTYQGFRNLITSEGNLQQYQDRAVQCLGGLAQQAIDKRIENLANTAGLALGIGIAGSVLSYVGAYIQYTHARNAIFNSNTCNANITEQQRRSTYYSISNYEVEAYSNYNISLSNLNIVNGFINTNITTSQTISKITTNEITYNGVEISTTLNNYLQKAGGTMSGRLNFNYGANFGTPVGGGGGSGERINLNTNGITISDYPPSLGVSGNSLWFSSPANHSYQWFNNGNQLMSLTSSGQLILNNPITTAERQYPPKAYTSSTNESVITFLGQSGMLSSTITLNPIGITYGSGVYEIYSSSRYNPSEYQKRDLFNYATTTNEVGGHWASGQYTQFGVYQGVAYIKPDYLGDFLVVKLPNPIILTKFRFYPRLGLNFRIPGEFKFYGSMNNIDYTEITQASQITPRLTTNDIINGYYEKTLAAGFNTPYLYIGFAVNKLMGTNFPDCVNFQEFQIYGKEVLSSTASLAIGTSDASTYALNVNGVVNASSYIGIGSSLTTLDYNNITLNKPLVFPPDPTAVQTTILTSTPNVSKKYMFTGTCTTSILMPDNITYFKYDIDLRNYTGLKYAPNPNTPYRIFKIKVFFGSVYFEYLTNNKPNVLSYEIYMSNESQGGGGGIGSAGVNICAIGYPENVILNAISPTQLSLVRTGDFNFISILSRVNGTVFNSIIEDCLF
jgi:hypothetical protein